jgi:CheY-like chemotaxis protein
LPDSAPVHLILVEDNEDHSALVRKSLRSQRVLNPLSVFEDAESALAYLRGGGLPPSSVILLDINLPGMDGLELLSILKSDPRLESLPVVVLSTSDAKADREAAYQRGANSYLVKPLDFEKFREMIKQVGLYWGVWNRPST